MNRFLPANTICTDFILDSDEAQVELHERGWSIGHVAIDGQYQVSGHKREKKRFVDCYQTEPGRFANSFRR